MGAAEGESRASTFINNLENKEVKMYEVYLRCL